MKLLSVFGVDGGKPDNKLEEKSNQNKEPNKAASPNPGRVRHAR